VANYSPDYASLVNPLFACGEKEGEKRNGVYPLSAQRREGKGKRLSDDRVSQNANAGRQLLTQLRFAGQPSLRLRRERG